MQRYITPFKDNNLLFRLTYYCNPEKSRKANYVEFLKQKQDSDSPYWDYTDYEDSNCSVVYKIYNGIHELERTAKQISQFANMVKIYYISSSGIWL